MTPPGAHAVDSIVRSCYVADDDLNALRDRFLAALRRAVPVDAAFMAVADPETLLFTRAWIDEPLLEGSAGFRDVEYASRPDVNRFADLAAAPDPVSTLDAATGGDRAASQRYRDVIAELGFGDEMRVALRAGSSTWGFMCLHRVGDAGFSEQEIDVLRAVAPHAANAIRRIVAAGLDAPIEPDAPAVVVVGDGCVLATGGHAEKWLEAIAGAPVTAGDPLPHLLASFVGRVEATGKSATPVLRVPLADGSLVTVHAARLRGDTEGEIVLTIAPAGSEDRASFLLAAFDLTPAQRRIAALVLRGRTTRQMMNELHISEHTVQDHLKAIFDKFGVRSRRDLVAAVFAPSSR